MRRTSWQLIAGAVLLVLLAVIATLQYRWLGQVSDAERERMRASLRTRASEFTAEFDGELTRTYMAFHVTSEQLDADADAVVSDAYARWQASSKAPALIRGVYLADGVRFDTARLQRLDPARRALEPAEWPADLAASLAQTHQSLPRIVGAWPGPPPMMVADAIDSRTPALIIAVPRINRSTVGGQLSFLADTTTPVRAVIVVFDAAQLSSQLLEPLVAKHFGSGAGGEYLLTITRRNEPGTVVYSSTDTPIDAAAADVTTGLFDLRMDELSRLADLPGARLPFQANTKMAITIVRRANGTEGQRVLITGGDQHGAWLARLRYRGGSLDAIVAQSRRRNMAISMGVLGLLAASFVLVLVSAERQQRLSRQQMEFVAAVSHELRTPLAVICSAGENLADGIVADGPHVKRYGSLIETEGRRLGDMVERVMAFAGISSGAPIRSRSDVDVSKIIAEAVDGVRHDARDRGVTIAVDTNGALLVVSGDADALRSAVQNVVGNAVKYSPSGATVQIAASAAGPSVEIRVADRGLGIDASDLPHIFKPFYRGRRAVDAEVRGSGVGLSVVRHVIDAHHGTICINSKAGEGTTVTMALPALEVAQPASEVAQLFKAAN